MEPSCLAPHCHEVINPALDDDFEGRMKEPEANESIPGHIRYNESGGDGLPPEKVEYEGDIAWRKGVWRQVDFKAGSGPQGDRTKGSSEGKAMGAWKHLRAVVLLPGMVLLMIPGTILGLTGVDTLGLWQSVPVSRVGLSVLGGVCVGLGLVLVVATTRLFVTFGKGTLAPWDPPRRLVVRGVYRHVRNPMMAGAVLALLGEALLSASLPLLGWFAFVGVVYAVYIPLSEEPGLVGRFGDDYLAYKRNVPRWIPRLTPWQADDLQMKVGPS